MTAVIRSVIFIAGIIILPFLASSQSLSINTDGSTADGSAILDVKSTIKGVLIPRMSKTEKNSIIAPATGLLVYQNAPDSTGFYFYNGSAWTWLSGSNTAWSTTGNVGTSPATNFLGTTDNNALVFKTNNTEQMRLTANKELGLGTATPNSTYGYAKMEIAAEGYGTPTDLLLRNAVSDAGYAPGIVMQHARGTLAAPLTVNNGDYLGFPFTVSGYDGSSYVDGAQMSIFTDGPVATNKVAMAINIATRDTFGNYGSRMIIKSNGLVGIGTSSPQVRLDVSGSSTVGSGNINNATSSMVTGINNKVNGVDVLVGGTNNYIAPGFGHAIAAGNLDSISGSATAVFGFLNKVTSFEAFAQGDRNTASGQASAAFGSSNTVSNFNGFVTGTGNTVSGSQASAFGQNNTISGSNSIASGNANIVSATNSFVSGITNTVNGTDVVVGGINNYVAPGFGHLVAVGNLDSVAGSATAVFGFLNKVTSFEAFAQGDRNTASGQASAAFGSSNTVSNFNGFVTGTGNAVSGSQASSFGQSNTISGNNSMVSGNANIVGAVNSFVSGITNNVNGTDVVVGGINNYVAPGFGHAIAVGFQDSVAGSASAVFGFLNKVTSFEAFAQGDRNTASGQASAAFGASNTVSSNSGFVTGVNNIVSGAQGSAFGAGHTVSGTQAAAFGIGNAAASYNEMALGMYGTTYTPVSPTLFDPTDRILNVGNGSASGSRADALTILKNGNTGIGTASPTSLLDINSNSLRLRNSKTPSSAIDTGNQGDIAWDSNFIYVCVATNTWKRVAIATW